MYRIFFLYNYVGKNMKFDDVNIKRRSKPGKNIIPKRVLISNDRKLSFNH